MEPLQQNQSAVKAWKPFNPVPNAHYIAESIKDIPEHLALTPLQDKQPKRLEWQTEPPVPRALIYDLIVKGEKATSKKTGKEYTRFWSGFGVRTGDISNGLLTFDIDGQTALPLLLAILETDELPHTVAWKSGKPGRFQLAFQVPDQYREALKHFTRRVVTEYKGLRVLHDEEGKPLEFLEFRYNGVQSVLPPSRHPQTGQYLWINSFKDTPVAELPEKLCQFILNLAVEQKKCDEEKERLAKERLLQQQQRKEDYKRSGKELSPIDFLEFEVLPRLNPEQIYNWSGHNFRAFGKTLKGAPPWRASQSGTSFHVWWDGTRWAWTDKAENSGGDAVNYRYRLKSGNGYPSSNDFIEIVRELAEDAGLQMPPFEPDEPASEAYEKYCEWQREQELIKEAEEEYRKELEQENKKNHEIYKRNLEVFFNKILVNGIKLDKVRDSKEELLAIFPELETKEGQDWLKMRQFTPDKVIESRYFDWEPNSSDTNLFNYAIKAGLGEGKTTWAHNTFLADTEKGANAFAHRNVLLQQFGKRGNDVIKSKGGSNTWYHLQTDLQTQQERFRLNIDTSRITACADSLPYFQPDAFVRKRLVLDEIQATFQHLYQSKTAVSYNRPLCKKRIGEAIKYSEATILLDGNLSDITVAHAERISGKKFFKIENKGTGKKRNVFLYDGSVTYKKNKETGETVANKKLDDDSLLHRIMLNDKDPLICASDAQEKLEVWEALLKAKGHKTFRLDGTNSKTIEAQIFLKDPAAFIIQNGITALLYSPTAECGISIDLHGYFKRAYFFFYGVVKTNQQYQFLDRIRDTNVDAYVFSKCKAINSQTPQVSEEIQKYHVQFTLDCANVSLSDLGDEEKTTKMQELANQLIEKSNDPHYIYECQLLAQQTFESANLRKCLEYALRTAGYQVKVVVGYQESKKDLQITQKNNQILNSQQIATAQDITAQEENNIIKDEKETLNKFESALDAKRAVVKRRLLQRLPGIEQKTQTKVTYVDVPQDVVKDIEAGQVLPEIAQKLGVSIPKPQAVQEINPVHLPPNIYIKPTEGGQLTIFDIPQSETTEKTESTAPETLTDKEVALVHLPQNISIKPTEGGQAPDTGMVRLEVTHTEAPVFDSDFVHRVLYKDRHLLTAVTLHFLLNNPDIAKLLQQRKWFKLLDKFTDPDALDSARNMSLTTYKSRWLQVYTLMQMGIEFFLKPGAVWTDETPEAISFWEKGKNEKIAKYIGVSVGKDGACAYIGRVLKTLDIKTKSKKLPKQKSTGKRPNSYRINQDYLDSPMRKAIYECVEESITKKVESADFIIDWDQILQNQHSLEEALAAEVVATQSLEPVHLPQNSYIKPTEGGQATDTNLDFCLTGLAKLEAALESPESSFLTNSDKVKALFTEMVMRGERCDNKLSEGFWEKVVYIIGLLFEKFENPKQSVLSTQHIEETIQLSNEDDEEEDLIVVNPRTFIYKGKDFIAHTFNELGHKIFVTIAQGTVLKEVMGADMCDLLWTTVTSELLKDYEPITVDFKDLQLVQ